MPSSSRHILRVGVTGGIGSGKSTVCRVFRNRGIPVISADLLARQLSDSDPRIRSKIIALLGPKAYGQKRMNRPYVAERLFGHPSIQASVNRIIHPRVIAEVNRRIREWKKKRKPVVVVEAALIYEAGMDRFLDVVLVVDAQKQKRIRRLRKRDGIPVKAIQKRMASQWSVKRKKEKAEIVLENNGSVADLNKKTRFVIDLLLTLIGRKIHA